MTAALAGANAPLNNVSAMNSTEPLYTIMAMAIGTHMEYPICAAKTP